MSLKIPWTRIELEHRSKISIRRILNKHIHLPINCGKVIKMISDPRFSEVRIRNTKCTNNTSGQYTEKANTCLIKFRNILRDSVRTPDLITVLFLFSDPLPFVQLYGIQLTAHAAVHDQFRAGYVF